MDFIILLKFGFVAVRDHSSSKVNQAGLFYNPIIIQCSRTALASLIQPQSSRHRSLTYISAVGKAGP
eukprot:scaffold6708_cov153-Skeletonema_marinoi.AAC.3